MRQLGLRLHADEEHWIPLSDMMTGLMFLFLLIALAYMVAVQNQQSKPNAIVERYRHTRADLYSALAAEFAPDLPAWGAHIDPKTLSVRFTSGNVLFLPGSAEPTPRFKAILDNFFPRYVRILNRPEFHDAVSEVRIEGFTSTFWRPGASLEESYIGNMALSQDRARAVLAYVLPMNAVRADDAWLMQTLTANGLSFSHLIRRSDGTQDAAASQRVEFSVRTDAERQIGKLEALEATPPPVATSATLGEQVPAVNAPRPVFPAWSSSTIGTPLQRSFPREVKNCRGYMDGAAVRYAAVPEGAKVFGWAYDDVARQPAQRIVFTSSNGTIAGAADGGFDRPDVPATIASIASSATGWEGYTSSWPIQAWAIVDDGRAVCRLATSTPAAAEGL